MAVKRAIIAAVATAGGVTVAAKRVTIAAVAIAAVAIAGEAAMVELHGSKKSYYSSCSYSR